MRKIYTAFLLLNTTIRCEAFGQGPESLGTGCTGVNLENVWSSIQNPSLLATAPPYTRYGIRHLNRFRIGNWNDVGMALTSRKSSRMGSGLLFTQEGIPGYRSTGVVAGIGIKASGSWYTGISIGLRQDRIGTKEGSVRRSVESHIGTVIYLSSKTSIAAAADDLQLLYLKKDKIPPSTTIRTGLSYHASETFDMILEVNGSSTRPIGSCGFIYHPATAVAIRIGYNGTVRQLSGGLGFRWKSWSIDTAFCHQAFLGTSTSVGITYTHIKHED